MGYVFFITAAVTIFTWAIGFIGYDAGIIKPILLVLTILALVVRTIVIKRKSSY